MILFRFSSRWVRFPAELEGRHYRVFTLNRGLMVKSKENRLIAERQPSSIDLLSPESPETIALGQLKVAPWIPFHLIIGIRHGSNVRRSSDGIVAYSSSYLEGAESELDVPTGHTVTHSPKTEEEVLRILKLNLGHPGALSDSKRLPRVLMATQWGSGRDPAMRRHSTALSNGRRPRQPLHHGQAGLNHALCRPFLSDFGYGRVASAPIRGADPIFSGQGRPFTIGTNPRAVIPMHTQPLGQVKSGDSQLPQLGYDGSANRLLHR
jgi:hypothetical protein